jgi:AcrR family transcriptional regulator
MEPREAKEQVVRDAKSNLILDAACKVFAEKGYHETRLDDIAATAGFSKASLYNYYEDKESIFLNILVRMHEKIIEALKSELREDRHIKENLTAMLRTIFKIYSDNFSFSLSMAELRNVAPISIDRFRKHHEGLTGKFKQYSRQMNDLAISVFTNARQRGEITTTLDDKTLYQYISSLIRGVFFEYKSEGKIGDTEIHIKNIMEFLTTGLGFTLPAKTE